MIASGPAETILPRTWSELVPPVARVRIVIVAALMLLVFWGPLKYVLVARWLVDGNWSHGWLIPAFSVYLLASRRDDLLAAKCSPSYFGAVILALSLAMFFVSAWWLRMAYPQGLAIIGAIFGVTLLLGGWGVMRVAWFPIAFLILAVPLPQAIYVELTMPLRAFASWVAAAAMPFFATGLYTEAQAVVIDYITRDGARGQLNVEEACSGMRLMMAFVTLGVAMAYVGDRPVWQRLVMVASCVPIAVACNAIRVTVTGLFHVYGHDELGRGTPHQLLGFVMLAIALGLFSALGYVLSRLFIEESDGADAASIANAG